MTDFYMAAHALIRKDELFLATRRSEINDYMPLKWDVPGGFVESGESMEVALKREIQEETNITVIVDKVLYIYSNLSQLPNKQVFQAVYLCEYADGEIKINPEEHDQYTWIKKEKFFELDAISFLESFLRQGILETL